MKRLLLAAGFSLFLWGCLGLPPLPGDVSVKTSAFDQSQGVYMEPAWVSSSEGFTVSSVIKFGLYKSSKMPKDEVVLTVFVYGPYAFAPGESLRFNVDGAMVNLTPIDTYTDIDWKQYEGLYTWKRYLITTAFLARLIDAERVVVRVDLLKTFVEGFFSKDGANLARPGFRKFREEIRRLDGTSA